MEEDEKLISKYSSGISILMRLNNLWIDANNHSRNGLFQKWNNDLDRIWCELARDLKEEEYNDITKDGKTKKGYKTLFEEFDNEIGAINDKAADGFEPLSDVEIKKRDKQYKVLTKKDLFLRRLENHIGKGTTWEDESEDEFD